MTEKNLYTCTREKIAAQFGAFIEGPQSGFFLVAADETLSSTAKDALDKSAEALGWQEGPTYVWVDTLARLEHEYEKKKSATTEHKVSGTAAFFEIIEGLDPVCVVLASEGACKLAEEAYRTNITPESRFRLFGRDACALANLEELLLNDAGKKRVWNLLKTLPHASTK